MIKKYLRYASWFVLSVAVVLSISSCSSRNRSGANTSLSLTLAQKRACLQMTTFCENDPYTAFQYNFAQNIGDGAGITFGCIGFTTGTYSGNILIKYYTILNPNNTLAKYIPALNRIDNKVQASGTKSSDVTGLDNFVADVQNCKDPLFKQAQKYQIDQLFWSPAVKMATDIGAQYPLTVAFIYDMCINHGQDRARQYVERTNTAMGGTPANGIDEKAWLERCINVRRTAYSNNKYRCDAFQSVLNTGNVNLDTPFSFSCYGDTCIIDGNVGY